MSLRWSDTTSLVLSTFHEKTISGAAYGMGVDALGRRDSSTGNAARRVESVESGGGGKR
jgi:hypothetical protein